MQVNADLTIWNTWYDKTLGYDVYKRTVIKGIHWYSQMMNQIGDGGMQYAQAFTARIPDTAKVDGLKKYVTPRVWDSLSEDYLKDVYTIKPGDKIVKGVSEFEVSNDVAGKAWADIADAHDECFTVSGYSDNRQGGTPHLKAVGS